jgi:hypothetical protein
MKRCIAAMLAICGAASRAPAVDNTLIEWQASVDNVNYYNDVTVSHGQRVWVRALVTYTGTASPLGLAAFVFQPTVSNWDATGPSVDAATVQTPGGVTNPSDPEQFGRYRPWGRSATSSTSVLTGFIHTNGSGGAPPGTWLRIAQAQVTSWCGGTGNTTGGSGIPISQLSDVGRTTSDPAFVSDLYRIPVYRFGVTFSNDTAARTLVVDTPANCFGNYNSATGDRQVYWYAALTESTGSIRGTPVVIPATIHVWACGTTDINGDGDYGTDADIEAFFACLAGNCCPTCQSADFNGDGDPGTDADIEAFFRVLAGGPC